MSDQKPKKAKKLKADGTPYKSAGPPHYSGASCWKPTPDKPVKNPKVEIDPEELERLAYLHVPQQVMADYFGLDRHYFKARVESDIELKRAMRRGESKCKIELAETQIRKALDCDPKNFSQATLLIWLAKNFLGMKDKPEGEQTAPTRIEFVFPEAPEPKREEPAPDDNDVPTT